MKIGDLVTPDNVGALPVGTIVRWTWESGEPCCAVRLGPVWWSGGYFDCDIGEGDIPAFIAYLPETT